MSRAFWQGMLFYVVGAVIASISIAFVLRIGWDDKEKIVIAGWGVLAAALGFLYKFLNQISKEEKAELHKKIESKADEKDMVNLKSQMNMMLSNLEFMRDTQAEMHATVENIHNILLKGKGGK
jgi:hypothetical protein